MKKLNYSTLVTPALIVLLVIAAFLIGSFWTKVQMLEKGGITGSKSLATAKPVTTTISNDKFNEIVKDAVFMSGNKDAKVKIVEFTDFECPFCARFFTDTFPQIEKEYIDSDKIAFYIRHFPLYSIHPNAEGASLAAECANEQGKFREMHDIIFENQKTMSIADLKGHAVKLGLDTTKFNSCLDSKKYKANVDRDASLGNEVGVSGTPAFFVNGKLISGAQAFATFKSTIDAELK